MAEANQPLLMQAMQGDLFWIKKENARHICPSLTLTEVASIDGECEVRRETRFLMYCKMKGKQGAAIAEPPSFNSWPRP